jgi:NlpC/P60 family
MLFPIKQRRYLFYLWNLSWFFLVVLLLAPVSYGIFRLATVCLIASIIVGALVLFWQHQIIRYTSIMICIISLLIAILPGHKFDSNVLREYYVQEMNSFLGTKYIWGGENKIGIDCSGLVRQGLVGANLKYGLLSLKPQLIREGISIWWFDASAQALAAEYRNKTKVIMKANSINELDHSKIQPGDIAVTQDGQHTLGYIGNKIWIEADPEYLKVIKVQVPEKNNMWFNVPIYIVQWQQFNLK